MPVRCYPLLTHLAAWTALLLSPSAARAAEHPQLLLRPDDLPRLRHACGVGTPDDARFGKPGTRAADFQALRAHFTQQAVTEPLPGEVLAAAFLNLVDPRDPGAGARLHTISAALAAPDWVTSDPLELVLAFDWCWPTLEPATRRAFMLAMRDRAEALASGDSPLEPRRFRDRLAAVALALAVDETDDPNPSWKLLRQRLLDEARPYFTTTLPTFITWRGLSPTSPSVAAREEADTALALEVARGVLGQDPWPEQKATVGRWLEHYLLATSMQPALQHDFLHDDGTSAPLTPAPLWRELLPVTAHLIAVRTRDPAAVAVAQRVEAALRESDEALALLWRWVPILLDIHDLPACDPRALPTARHLGGAVILRGGSGTDQTAIWIDAAQPFLRRRQHFDAGHFVVYRGGHLVNMAGDDIAFEALKSKGGQQQLGQQKEPFDFEQFFTSTIAHNSVIAYDAARLAQWHGARYLPAGGQRPIDETCRDFTTPLAGQGRATGRTVAYGQQAGAAYVALDLAPAYDPRAVAACTREFVFCCERVLIVIDRVTLTSSRAPPTWILNLPSRPTVDGQPLRDEQRAGGSTNQAGWWRCDATRWLRWTDQDGALWLAPLQPTNHRLRVVGGPAEKQTIAAGPFKGRTYTGGAADGFERLIIPADRHGAANAWYRLGAPEALGADFGKCPHWGRIECEPTDRAADTLFVAALITDAATATAAPTATVERDGNDLVVRVRAGDSAVVLRLSEANLGGTLVLEGRQPLTWTLPTEVQPDGPLARP